MKRFCFEADTRGSCNVYTIAENKEEAYERVTKGEFYIENEESEVDNIYQSSCESEEITDEEAKRENKGL